MGIYAPTLWYGFVGDDLIYFIGNPSIRSFDVLAILRHGAIGADYLPLRDISFAIDYLLWGENPIGFHLMNVLLYGITVVCVRRLYTALNDHIVGRDRDRPDTPSFVAAVVFMVHPYHREVVCAVFNRGAVLTVLFCTLSFLSYLRSIREDGRSRGAYILALLCALFALLSREYSIVLPFLLTLIVLFGERGRIPSRILRLLPFYLLGAAFYFVYRQYAVTANFIAPDESLVSGVAGKVATAFRITAFYLMRLVTLSGECSVTAGTFFAAVSVLVTTALLAVFFRLRRAHPQMLFGYLFYLVALLPVLNFYRTTPVLAVRYTYLPFLGMLFLPAALAFEGKKKLVHLVILIYACSWSYATAYEMRYFSNDIAYWEYVASYDQSAMVYERLGQAYYRGGRYERTVEALFKVSPAPQDPVYYTALGDACLQLGDYSCAVQALGLAVTFGGGQYASGLHARAQMMLGGRKGAVPQ